jgi:hypothetical protein
MASLYALKTTMENRDEKGLFITRSGAHSSKHADFSLANRKSRVCRIARDMTLAGAGRNHWQMIVPDKRFDSRGHGQWLCALRSVAKRNDCAPGINHEPYQPIGCEVLVTRSLVLEPLVLGSSSLGSSQVHSQSRSITIKPAGG